MNLILIFLGWLLWNWIEFNVTKNEYDNRHEAFPFSQYKTEKWEDWIGSLICAAFLLVIGHMGLGLDLLKSLDFNSLQWSDLYYGASGVMYEAIKFAIKKWRDLRK